MKKITVSFFCLILISFFSSCSKKENPIGENNTSTGKNTLDGYFPNSLGSSWTMKVTNSDTTGGTFTISIISGDTTVNNIKYLKFKASYLLLLDVISYYRVDSNAMYGLNTEETNDSIPNPPYETKEFDIFLPVGSKWSYKDYDKYSKTSNIEYTIISKDTSIIVNNINYSNCICTKNIEKTTDDLDFEKIVTSYHFYSKGIGLIYLYQIDNYGYEMKQELINYTIK